jgi:hypothetical protein
MEKFLKEAFEKKAVSKNFFEIDAFIKNAQYMSFLQKIFRDPEYNEVDGVYIVFQGHVDILSHKDRSCLH